MPLEKPNKCSYNEGMLVKRAPDLFEKLTALGDAARFEPAGDNPEREHGHRQKDLSPLMSCITEVATPGGPKPVLKGMVTSACERDCYYCPFRAGRSRIKRLTFTPDEIALAFDRLQRSGAVDGIFLSSGIIKGSVGMQDKILDTIEIIRSKYRYEGYVHVKIMPGAERDQLLRAMQLADRISINLEGPTPERLHALAPRKDFHGELLQRMRWAHEIQQDARENMPGAVRASIVTQYVVGAVGDTDLELLSLTNSLHRHSSLKRAYFSRFNPVADTPFENRPATPLQRQNRLYQASFLLRDYEWDIEDMPLEGEGNLRLDVDPKRAWAEAHLIEHPVDIMLADRLELLRVPGIGPKGAARILRARQQGRLKSLDDLKAIGVRDTRRASPFVLFDGHRPDHQLRLF